MIQPVLNTPNIHPNVVKPRFSSHKITLAPDYNRVKSKEAPASVKAASAIGAAAGAALAVAAFAKKQNKSFFNVEYGLKEMLGLGLGAIGGGVLGGVLTSNRKKHERKVDEGIFQYSMVALPGFAVSGATYACEKIKPLNNAPAKIAGTVLALAGGMEVAVDVANFVSDIDNNEPDRKLTFKDAIASVDDIIGILVLAKIKAVKTLKLERLLPAVYAYCGYKAGTTN